MHAQTVTRAAVLGFGTMGYSIAKLLASSGIDVNVSDLDLEDVTLRVANLTAVLARGVADTKIGKVRALKRPEVAQAVDVVFEAVPEDLALKVDVLRSVLVQEPGMPILTNTSAIPVDEIASRLDSPPGLMGVHFFNPADIVPGVEVVPARSTDPVLVRRIVDLLVRIGKVPTIVRSSPGFVANRLQLALFAEASRCVEEGLASAEDVDRIVRTTFGLRLAAYGPFAIADMAGLDVFLAVLQQLATAFGERFSAPHALVEHVEDGRLGAKTGAGYFAYTTEDLATLATDRDRVYARVIHAAQTAGTARH